MKAALLPSSCTLRPLQGFPNAFVVCFCLLTQQKNETKPNRSMKQKLLKSKIGFGFCFWQLRSLCLKFENFHAYKRSGALPFAILGFSFFFLIGYQPDSEGPIIDLIVDKAANNHEPLVQCWFGFLKLFLLYGLARLSQARIWNQDPLHQPAR